MMVILYVEVNPLVGLLQILSCFFFIVSQKEYNLNKIACNVLVSLDFLYKRKSYLSLCNTECKPHQKRTSNNFFFGFLFLRVQFADMFSEGPIQDLYP